MKNLFKKLNRKELNHLLRLTTIVILSLYFIKKVLSYKYQSFALESLFIGGFAIIALLIWFWVIFRDFKLYVKTKYKRSYISALIGIFAIISVITINTTIDYEFNKPSLFQVSFSEDMGSTNIDFKKDSTFIIEDTAYLSSWYSYGNYFIKHNQVIIKDYEEWEFMKTGYFELKKHREITDVDSLIYLMQVNKKGIPLLDANKFKLTIDNRSLK